MESCTICQGGLVSGHVLRASIVKVLPFLNHATYEGSKTSRIFLCIFSRSFPILLESLVLVVVRTSFLDSTIPLQILFWIVIVDPKGSLDSFSSILCCPTLSIMTIEEYALLWLFLFLTSLLEI